MARRQEKRVDWLIMRSKNDMPIPWSSKLNSGLICTWKKTENSRDRNRYAYELLILLGSKMSFVNMTYFITLEGR